MARNARPLLVRSREIWREPAPAGGTFDELSVTPFPLPNVATYGFGTFCVQTTRPVFSITYDDGPHPEHTPRILDTLAEHAATATFFVLADQVAAHPDIARRITEGGHELALHGKNHTALTRLPDVQALRQIRDARSTVEDITGTPLRLFRPPYGMHTWRQAVGIRRMGLDLVIWSNHAWDWIDADPGAVAARALAGVFAGGVLLLHDHRADPETLEVGQSLPAFNKADVLARILAGADARGFTTMRAGDLLAQHRHVRSALRDRMARR